MRPCGTSMLPPPCKACECVCGPESSSCRCVREASKYSAIVVYCPPSARMYFLAIRPVSNSARRSWRLRLLVRPESKWRLLHWWRLTLPEAVIFIRFLTLLLVFCLGIVCRPRPLYRHLILLGRGSCRALQPRLGGSLALP